MNNTLLLVIFAICSYFLGNVNWALIVSKLKKSDIRKLGSGNPGTLNMSRNFGLKLGLLTFGLDIMKGFLPAMIAYLVFKGETFNGSTFYISDFAMILSGFCAVLGHIYPVFLKFKGGKGIASTIGVMAACSFFYGWAWAVVFIMALIVAGLFIYFTEFGAMGSFLAISPPAVGCCIRLYLDYFNNFNNKVTSTFNLISCMIIFAICLLTWVAHRKNIERMIAGEEHPTSIKEMVVKHKANKLKKQQNLENK